MIYPYRNPKVATRTIDGEAVAVNAQESTLHTLNEVGTFIWELADGNLSVEEIADRLTKFYSVEYPEALADVQAFCQELNQRKILFLSDAPRH